MGMKKLLLYTIILLWATVLSAQNIRIEMGPEEIGENEVFRVTIVVENDRLRSYSTFPNIEGFVKRGTSSSSSTNIVNGQRSFTQSITQNYMPLKQGSVLVPDVTMTINGEEFTGKGIRVTIGPAVQTRNRNPWDTFNNRDPFNRKKDREPVEFIDIKEDAFLALTTDKSEVYVGEGINAVLAFYVAEANRAPMDFYDLGKQLSDILKELKPANCWEENFSIENISGKTVEIRGKRYTQYKIYQASFFPLNTEPIRFPSVGLKMIKYKIAKNPTFFGQNRKEDFKTFMSQPKRVAVTELPPHPLRDAVSVGTYRIRDEISSPNAETGNSFNYEFQVFGRGNISAINKPIVTVEDEFEFYDPNIHQTINRNPETGLVTGAKRFSYYGIPQEPGNYDLSDHFQWIYFDPDREEYDTLVAARPMVITGESKKNQAISASDMGSFYDKIITEDNKPRARGGFDRFRPFVNIFILLLVVASGIILFRKQS